MSTAGKQFWLGAAVLAVVVIYIANTHTVNTPTAPEKPVPPLDYGRQVYTTEDTLVCLTASVAGDAEGNIRKDSLNCSKWPAGVPVAALPMNSGDSDSYAVFSDWNTPGGKYYASPEQLTNDPGGKMRSEDSSPAQPSPATSAAPQEPTPVPVGAVITWTDPATGLMWTKKDNGIDVTWPEAMNYCRNLQLGGQSAWRLPTINELQGIYDSSINAPGQSSSGQAVPWQVKGNLLLSAWGEWSSSQGNAPDQAWVFGFGSGKPFSYRFEGSKKPRALCVYSSSTASTTSSGQ